MAESAGRSVVGFGTRTSKLEVLKVAKDLESADAVTPAQAGVRSAESVNARIYPRRAVQCWLATPINTPSRIGGTVLMSILTTRDNTPANRAVLRAKGPLGWPIPRPMPSSR